MWGKKLKLCFQNWKKWDRVHYNRNLKFFAYKLDNNILIFYNMFVIKYAR